MKVINQVVFYSMKDSSNCSIPHHNWRISSLHNVLLRMFGKTFFLKVTSVVTKSVTSHSVEYSAAANYASGQEAFFNCPVALARPIKLQHLGRRISGPIFPSRIVLYLSIFCHVRNGTFDGKTALLSSFLSRHKCFLFYLLCHLRKIILLYYCWKFTPYKKRRRR